MNLDFEAAKTAKKIISETKGSEGKVIENLITKTIGVLQDNGVYACMLYLYSLSTESTTPEGIIRKGLLKMTELLGKKYDGDDNTENALGFLTDSICNDLDTLFLTKQLWEQTLTYARYGAKARG
jgi:hypothetical protein